MSNDESSSNGWNPDLVSMLKEWQVEAMGWIYIHGKAADSYKFWHWVMFIISGSITVICSAGAIAVGAIDTTPRWLTVLFGGLALVAGAITAVDDQMIKGAKTSAKHEEAQKKWQIIPKKIQVQLKKHVDHRIDGDQFSMEIEKEFVDTLSSSPHTNGRFIREWITLRDKYASATCRLSGGARGGAVGDIRNSGGSASASRQSRSPRVARPDTNANANANTNANANANVIVDTRSRSIGHRPSHHRIHTKDATTSRETPEKNNTAAGKQHENDGNTPHRRHTHEHFGDYSPDEKIKTLISEDVPAGQKFSISLNYTKREQLKVGGPKPQYAIIESPYHENLILNPEDFLKKQYFGEEV